VDKSVDINKFAIIFSLAFIFKVARDR